MIHGAPLIKCPKRKNSVVAKKKFFVGLFLLFGCFFGVGLHADTGTVESFSMNHLLHFGTDVPAAFKPVNGGTNINGTLLGATTGLQVLRLGYKSSDTGPLSDSEISVIVAQGVALDASIPAEVIGKALFYPNPARQSDLAKLGYQLSKNMDIELQMYDMMANRIFKNTFSAGTNGGKSGYNKLTLNMETFSGYALSAGVYFYLIMHDGKVLAKGKVAVIP